jgi:hypothetical protein
VGCVQWHLRRRRWTIRDQAKACRTRGRARNDVRSETSSVAHATTSDLPLNFHPAAIRAWAVLNTPSGAVVATGGNA